MNAFRLSGTEDDAASNALILFGFIAVIIVMSFVNSINYAMESAIEKLRGWADMVRGMDEKYKLLALNGLPQVIFHVILDHFLNLTKIKYWFRGLI